MPALLTAAGAVLRRYVRWREALIAGMQLMHFGHWAVFQAPLLTQFLSAAKLSNPLWMARVTSIEARAHQTPPSIGGPAAVCGSASAAAWSAEAPTGMSGCRTSC